MNNFLLFSTMYVVHMYFIHMKSKCPKHNKNSTDSCFFVVFGQYVLKISAILHKYPTLRENKCKIKFYVHCRVPSKNFNDIKVGKLSIFALKCTLWEQNRLTRVDSQCL